MSLTKDQQKELAGLSKYFRNMEEMAVQNNIDLDVFISEYKDDGFAVYATEKISLKEKASKRKKVFEKAGREKEKPVKK